MLPILQSFLEKYWDGKSILLLGLSGGPDSRALFHALLALKVPFHAAHVDHGWRLESGSEAEALRKLCENNGIPFHCRQISPEGISGNLEDGCRQARLVFFRELLEVHGFAALLLAHHADDQAETVLKRVLEGATLPSLRGLMPETNLGRVTIWRPLLKLSKKEIYSFLEEPAFDDPTNRDSRFLRARMRTEILPQLQDSFGKGVVSSLCRLADSALELSAFVEKVVQPYKAQIIKAQESIFLDLSEAHFSTDFEWKVVVREFFASEKITVSAAVMEVVILHLKKRSSKTNLAIGKSLLTIHRGTLCLNLKSSIEEETRNKL